MENELLKQASLGKRFLSYLIDFLIATVIGFVLNRFVTSNYVFEALGGKRTTQELYSYAADSGLTKAEKNEDGLYTNILLYGFTPDGTVDSSASASGYSPTPSGDPGYVAYLDMIWNYYTVFFPTDSRLAKEQPEGYVYKENELDSYKSYVYTSVFKLTDPETVLLQVKAGETPVLVSNDEAHPYFQYATDGEGKPNVTVKPVLRQEYVDKLASEETKKTTLTSLRDYFFSVGATSNQLSGVYYDSAVHMQMRNYFVSHSREVNIMSWECSLIAHLPFNFIIFFLIPIFDKEGRTIGKHIFKLSVVSNDGVLMNPLQRTFRPLIMVVLISLLMIPNSMLNFLVFGIVALVDFGVLAFSRKTPGALHDKLMKTAVVSRKDSIYFENQEDKEEYLLEHAHDNEEEKEENARLAAEDAILDLSTLNKRREEAKNITSFDEFEKQKDQEAAERAAQDPANRVNLNKEEDDKPE